MSLESQLIDRCQGACELCQASGGLVVYLVEPGPRASAETSAMLCQTCAGQIDGRDAVEVTHWHCLRESMWTQVPGVQVLVYRMLQRLSGEGFARDLMDMLYLDQETKAWAEATSGVRAVADEPVVTVDSNGTPLAAGDTVTLIKDLVVKGANFTAKRGTTVKNIVLTDDPKLIEARLNGTHIVLVAAYLKKA